MDSLPNEFLSHHLPLMFFAGLDPSSTNPTPTESSNQPNAASQDKFIALIETLRTVLSSSKSSLPSIWHTRKTHPSTLEYRILFVPKAIRFPPRKTRPSSVSTTSTNAIPHSPLSPLSQTSPLFPNGIMTPIWVRKHRDMIPSVFVLVLKLWEAPQRLGTRPNDDNLDRSEREKYDDELIHEIIDRKKTTFERGIKLTVIILASRYMLDNPQLDARLSHIRKRSSLDARASLFVLSPVPLEDVVSFVNTLKSELSESTMDYYREHSRRVRRKRTRSSSNAFTQSTIYHQPGQPLITPLGPQGWNVRSDYKLATFAEFRQEFEVAIKSYEDSWEGLIQMFNSTAVLPPRTKRWAEAKIFIDCISFKISKLYLYSNEPTRAMHHFNKHIHKFRELFNGWGIGDETFEFWSWLSKQYTVLADLVDIGCRNGMRLPNLCPPPSAIIDKNRSSGSPVILESRLAGGGAINLTGVLVHPGFYYFYAAECAVERRDRFSASNAAEEEMRSVAEAHRDSTRFQPSISLAHERKINHSEMIISLYTKAYEIFKTVGSNRMTLFLALKIALVHHRQNDHATSYKFFERILASYRKGTSETLLNDILYLSYENLKGLVPNSQAIGTSEPGQVGPRSVTPEAIKLLKIILELLGKDLLPPYDASQRVICNTLISLFQPPSETSSFSGEVIKIDMEPLTFPVKCQVAFWESSIHLGEEVEFQVLLRMPQIFAECKPPITQIELKFASLPVLTISHQSSQLKSSTQILNLEIVPESSQQHRLNLQVEEKSDWLITGRLKPSAVHKIILEKVIFRLDKIMNGYTVDFAIAPDLPENLIMHPLQWIEKLDIDRNELVFLRTESFQPFCHVQHKKPKVAFTLDHEPCGIIDERRTLRLEFHNNENDLVNLRLRVKLQSPSSCDSIEFDGQTYKNPQDLAISVGNLKPDQVLQKSLHFIPTEIAGLRAFEISLAIKSIPNGFNANDHNADEFNTEGESLKTEDDDDMEKLESLRIFKLTKKASIYIEELVRINFNLQNFHQLHYPVNCNLFTSAKPLSRLNFNFLISNSCHQNPEWSSSLSVPIQIRSVSLSLEKASCSTRILSCSLKADNSSDLNIDLNSGDLFAISYIIEIELDPSQEEISNSFFEVSWVTSPDGIAATHVKSVPLRFEMPTLLPITVLTDLKPHLRIFQPVKIDYLIENRNLVRTVDVLIKIQEKKTNEDNENDWILSGPKFINSMLILPRSFKTISFIGIPTKLGNISAPQVEIFERDYQNLHHSNRLLLTQEPTSSLTDLKDLQELDFDFDDHYTNDLHDGTRLRMGGNSVVGLNHLSHQQSVKFVQVPIFRSRSLVVHHGLNEDQDTDRNDSHSAKLRQDLKVLVLPA